MTQPVEITASEDNTFPALKPSWQTGEFWATHIFALLSLATALGWIGPNFAHDHEGAVNAVALLASVIAPSAYAVGRSLTKGKHQAAAASVAVAKITATTVPPLP